MTAADLGVLAMLAGVILLVRSGAVWLSRPIERHPAPRAIAPARSNVHLVPAERRPFDWCDDDDLA